MAIIKIDEPIHEITENLNVFNNEGLNSVIYTLNDALLKVLNYPVHKNEKPEMGLLSDYEKLIHFSQLNDGTFIAPRDIWCHGSTIVAYTMRYAKGSRFDKLAHETCIFELLDAIDTLRLRTHEILTPQYIAIADLFWKNIYYGNAFEVGDLDGFNIRTDVDKSIVERNNDWQLATYFYHGFRDYFNESNFDNFVKGIKGLFKFHFKRDYLEYEELREFVCLLIQEIEKISGIKTSEMGGVRLALKLINESQK